MSDPERFRAEFGVEATPKAWHEFVRHASFYGINIVMLSEKEPVASPSVLIELFESPGKFSKPLITRDAATEFIAASYELDSPAKAEATRVFNQLESHYKSYHHSAESRHCSCPLRCVWGHEVGVRERGIEFVGIEPKSFAEFALLSADEIAEVLYPYKKDSNVLGAKRIGWIRAMGSRLMEDMGWEPRDLYF